ncbi:MgtC/SapB family protein [Permianibacter sp. IMCC34836]|uniref:MgtC/SapB family protein n=1 Tax=Permianibacter fluminis TaxID=2738515 RepID=UPI001553387C|nr:MgtC/SapB family protein [Permianibacter fluminis]NQD37094.1 MgtC/SapB family protein [Permianibacter fluminis]
MELSADIVLVRDFAIALAIGALVGVEREKHRERSGHGAAGLRSFMLIAETGALAAWLGQQLAAPWLVAAVLLALALVIGPLSRRSANGQTAIATGDTSPERAGITTSIAALTVFLLGAVTLYGHAELAVALAITTSAILAFREPMHGLVRKIDTDDIYAGLKLLIATFIVLPLIPNRTLDPWGAFNPFQLWSLVIIISALSLVGYVAMRWLGSERGIALTALSGGLVSSTAVTLSFARRSHEQVETSRMLATGVLIAWLVMYARVLIEVAVVHPPLVWRIGGPLLALAFVCAVLAGYGWQRNSRDHNGLAHDGQTQSGLLHNGLVNNGHQLPVTNPFSLVSATQFALFFTAVLFVVKLSQHYLPSETLYGVAALAGFAEVDSITLSLASMIRDGGDIRTASHGILLATLTNTWTKAGLVLVLATAQLRRPILLATLSLTATTLLLMLVM